MTLFTTSRSTSATLAFALLIFSCTKEDEPEVCTLVHMEQKTTYPETSQMSGQHTISDYEFSGSQLMAITYKDADNLHSGTHLTIEYDANGKPIRIKDDLGILEGQLTYDGESRLTEYLIGEPSDGILSTYRYNASNQLEEVKYFSVKSTSSTLSFSIIYEHQNSSTRNYTKQHYYYTGQDEPAFTMEYEWDNKKSPYAGLPEFLSLGRGMNNIVKITTSYPQTAVPGNFVYTQTYQYNYNESGLPVRRVSNQSLIGLAVEEITYEYKCQK